MASIWGTESDPHFLEIPETVMTVHDTPKNELPQVEGSIVVSAMLANCKKRGQTPSLARWQCINMSKLITLIFSIKHHRTCAGFPKTMRERASI